MKLRIGEFRNILFGGLIVKIANIILGIILTIILTNILGAEDYGKYVIIISFITVLSAFSHLGFPQILLKEAARYRSRGDRDFSLIVKQTHILAIALMLIAFGFGYQFILPSIELNDLDFLYLVLPILAFTVLGRMRSSAVRGLGRVILGQLPESILRPGFIFIMIFFVHYYLDQAINARSAIIYYLVASLVAFLFGSWLLRRSMKNVRFDNKTNFSEGIGNIELFRMAVVIGVGSSFQLLIGNMESLFLGAMRSPSEVGMYKVALTIAFLIFAMEQSLNSVVTPRISTLIHEEQHYQLKKLCVLVARLTVALSALVYCIIIIFGDLAVSAVFGKDFAPAYQMFVVIGGGMLLANLFGPVLQVLVMSGHERFSLVASLVAITVNGVMNYFFIDLYGAMGAAYSTSLSFFFWKLMMWFFLRRRIGAGYTAVG